MRVNRVVGIILLVASRAHLHAISPSCLSAIKSSLTQVHEEEVFASGFEAKVAFEELKNNMEEKVKSMSDAELHDQLDTWIRNTIAFRSRPDSEGYLPGQSDKMRTRNLAELLEAEKKERTALANVIANVGGIMAENSAEFAFDHSVEMANQVYNGYKKAVYPAKMLEELHRRLYKDNYPEIYHREAAKQQYQQTRKKTETLVQRLQNTNLISEVATHYGDIVRLLTLDMQHPGYIKNLIESNPAFEVESNMQTHFGAGQATLPSALNSLRLYETNVYKLKLLVELQARMSDGRINER